MNGACELPPSPADAFRARLLDHVAALEAQGGEAEATALRETVAAWSAAHAQWIERVAHAIGLHHEINNALVGVRGNAQLLMMGPSGREPAVRERLEVVMRESARIQNAAVRLQEIKTALAPGGIARAA